jgi:hypothetical protein
MEKLTNEIRVRVLLEYSHHLQGLIKTAEVATAKNEKEEQDIRKLIEVLTITNQLTQEQALIFAKMAGEEFQRLINIKENGCAEIPTDLQEWNLEDENEIKTNEKIVLTSKG